MDTLPKMIAVFIFIMTRIHAPDFMRPHRTIVQPVLLTEPTQVSAGPMEAQGTFWLLCLIPAGAVAILGSFQLDADGLLQLPSGTLATLGAVLSVATLTLWAIGRPVHHASWLNSGTTGSRGVALFQRVAHETNFVFSWVVMSFLLFELTIWATGWDLGAFFGSVAFAMPLVGVLVGLLPGCGPQILVTTLYISGSIPMSAQLGNAISNDGDALFPAIALAPQAAVVATLYTALPALAVAYGYAALFETIL